MKASLPIHKRELERFFKDYGELRSLVYGVDAVKDRLYFCFLSDESYLIQEIQKIH